MSKNIFDERFIDQNIYWYKCNHVKKCYEHVIDSSIKLRFNVFDIRSFESHSALKSSRASSVYELSRRVLTRKFILVYNIWHYIEIKWSRDFEFDFDKVI